MRLPGAVEILSAHPKTLSRANGLEVRRARVAGAGAGAGFAEWAACAAAAAPAEAGLVVLVDLERSHEGRKADTRCMVVKPSTASVRRSFTHGTMRLRGCRSLAAEGSGVEEEERLAGQDSGRSGKREEEESSRRVVQCFQAEHAARSTQQHARRQNQAAGAAPVKWAAAENASCPSSHGAGGCPGRETPPARDSRAGTMEPLGGLRQLQLPAPATGRERREPAADRGRCCGVTG